MNGKIKHVNPEGLLKSPVFFQVVTTRGSGATIYIGGQNSINANGEVIGKGDIQTQTDQALYNIDTALKASGATFDHIVKLTFYIVEGQDVSKVFQTFQQVFKFSTPPSITSLIVSGLANPDYLIEMDAVAFLPN
jgi:enamine deaminase RidA (YjgF/YER057c/UK114 family)